MFPHPRAHYRLRYPESARPLFILSDKQTLSVVDCSELGFRYCGRGVALEQLPDVGAEVRGQIRFHGGKTVHVSGVVVRIQDCEVAVHLTEAGIPFTVMMQEQLFLRRHFPFYYEQSAA